MVSDTYLQVPNTAYYQPRVDQSAMLLNSISPIRRILETYIGHQIPIITMASRRTPLSMALFPAALKKLLAAGHDGFQHARELCQNNKKQVF